MDDILTLAQIYERFPSEWVLIGDPQTDENLEVQSARVLFHSKDRDEVYRKAIELRPKHCGFLFTGTMPEGTAIVL